jgi:hypothetical protein
MLAIDQVKATESPFFKNGAGIANTLMAHPGNYGLKQAKQLAIAIETQVTEDLGVETIEELSQKALDQITILTDQWRHEHPLNVEEDTTGVLQTMREIKRQVDQKMSELAVLGVENLKATELNVCQYKGKPVVLFMKTAEYWRCPSECDRGVYYLSYQEKRFRWVKGGRFCVTSAFPQTLN